MKKVSNTSVNLRALLMGIVFAFFLTNLSAQKSNLNFSVNYRVSGNGLGSFIVPQVSYKGSAHEIMLGPAIQKRNMHVSGLSTRYNYNLPKIGNAEFFFFCDASYYRNSVLGNSYVKKESFAKPENSNFYKTVKLQVIEQHAGFGIKFLRRGNINGYALIGAGAYATVGSYALPMFRFRDRAGSSLIMGVGLNIKLHNAHR
jgi:hypothetical protein